MTTTRFSMSHVLATACVLAVSLTAGAPGAGAGSPVAAERSAPARAITFTDIAAGLPPLGGGSVAWGDYDGDGDLDLLLAGYETYATSHIYRNDGGTFTEAVVLSGVGDGAVAWGDYDNDGDLDLVLTGDWAYGLISRIYRNDAGVFTDIVAGLPGVEKSAVAWGDYDNDGDLDLELTGYTISGTISRVYRNDAGAFVDIAAGLPGIAYGSVAWGDYDNDGDLDLLLTGLGSGPVSRVYRNDAGAFTDIGAGLVQVWSSAAAWGDYDNDGDLDIVLSGSGTYARVYRNDGGTFVDVVAGLQGVGQCAVAWGDYDNDGDLDLVLTGSEQYAGILSRIYRNDGGTFTDISAGLPGVYDAALGWGDYDNDGDLDLVLAGNTGSEEISRIYRNAGAPANSPPTAPTNLSATRTGNDVEFNWTAATDAQTPAAGLSYNLRIGTAPGACQVMPAMASAVNGYRRVVQLGNAQQRTSWTVALPAGLTYYWNVQAVDGAWAGSAPAAEEAIAVYACGTPAGTEVAVPLGPAVELTFDQVTTAGQTQAAVQTTGPIPPDGLAIVPMDPPTYYDFTTTAAFSGSIEICIAYDPEQLREPESKLLMKHYNAALGTWESVPAVVDSVNNVICGTTSSLSPFIVAEDTVHTVVVTFTDVAAGLPQLDRGALAWGDYDDDGDLDLVATGHNGTTGTCRVMRNDGGSFVDAEAVLPGSYGTYAASASWGDYDRDGDLDLLLAGYSSGHRTRLYRNDAGTFVEVSTSLQGIDDGAAVWGDYDNDGDLDIALAGHTGALNTGVARVYRNDAGIFVNVNAGLPGVFYASVAWGDYDGDGDLDLALAGETGTERLTRLYRNDEGMFVDSGVVLPALDIGSLAWGDYDADGDPDLLLTGESPGLGGIARVYRNDGGVLSDVGAGLLGLYCSSAAWGDYDNDGDLDILIAGGNGSGQFARVYRNDAGAFVDIVAGLTGVYKASATWGDYDHDGDLDIALCGYDNAVRITRVYRSDGALVNAPPTPPTNLTAVRDGDDVTFSWAAASDTRTPSAGLSYNLRVGTSPGACDVMPAMADPVGGYRRVVQLGNAQQRTSWTLRLPLSETRHWGVQAIDGAFAGSEFASGTLDVSAVEDGSVPRAFVVRPNVPNPFRDATSISYDLPSARSVDLAVYDTAGRRVRTLRRCEMSAGRHEESWNGRDDRGRALPVGRYFLRVAAGACTGSQAALLLR